MTALHRIAAAQWMPAFAGSSACAQGGALVTNLDPRGS
jgi:hypothetical protein